MPDLPSPEPDLETFLQESLALLTERNAAHGRAWGLGEAASWQLDMDRQRLLFSFPDGRQVAAEAQIVGSLNVEKGTWLWAWANSSVDSAMSRDASGLRAWGERWHLGPLTIGSFEADEDDGWAMTGLALRLFGADGAYRAPVEGLRIFFTFRNPIELAPN
jgi:hypothetical protein